MVKNMRGVAMPSRTYNLLAAGKPILALTEENSEVARVIEEDRVGWVVPPSEPSKLLQIIYKIFDERNLLNEIGHFARASALGAKIISQRLRCRISIFGEKYARRSDGLLYTPDAADE